MPLNIIRLSSQTDLDSFASTASATYLAKNTASVTYLTKNSASATYLDQISASTTYLDKSNASTTYLDKVSASSTYANLSTTQLSGFRNKIINGDFSINQRNFTSSSTTGSFIFDRWIVYSGSEVGTYSIQKFIPGEISGYESENYARIQTVSQSSSTSYTAIAHRIEDVRTFAGKQVTLSFWAKANSGTPKLGFAFNQNMGSGGTPTNPTWYLPLFTISTTWTRYSATFNIPSISASVSIGTSSYLQFWLYVSSGSAFSTITHPGVQSNTFDFWGFQLEPGPVATPFEQRSIGTELALCQRYYYRISPDPINGYLFNPLIINGYITGTVTQAVCSLPLPVQMRDTPTLLETSLIRAFITSSNIAQNISSIVLGPSTNKSLVVVAANLAAAGTTGQQVQIQANNSLSAYIGVSAEL